MVGELGRKLGPIMTLVLLLGMGVDVLDPFGVSAEAPALFRVRAQPAFPGAAKSTAETFPSGHFREGLRPRPLSVTKVKPSAAERARALIMLHFLPLAFTALCGAEARSAAAKKPHILFVGALRPARSPSPRSQHTARQPASDTAAGRWPQSPTTLASTTSRCATARRRMRGCR